MRPVTTGSSIVGTNLLFIYLHPVKLDQLLVASTHVIYTLTIVYLFYFIAFALDWESSGL